MFRLDPYVKKTISLLEECSRLSDTQLVSLDEFIRSNKKEVEDALVLGLADPEEGHNVALKLLKLQTERLEVKSTTAIRQLSTQRPVEESRFFLAIVSQVFRTVQEWMRVNNIDRITVDTLPDLQEHIVLELVAQNGYRSLLVSGDDESDTV